MRWKPASAPGRPGRGRVWGDRSAVIRSGDAASAPVVRNVFEQPAGTLPAVFFWEAVLWLHLLAMAFFVGGQLVLAAVVVPVLRGAEDRAPLRAAARRFGAGTLVAIAVLVVTGAA